MTRAAVLGAVSCWALMASAQPPAGWSVVGEVERYDRSNVYEAINGAAETYLAYGFRSLHLQTLKSGAVEVSVQRYELGSPLDAFGVFQLQRPAEARDLKFAPAGAFAPPDRCLAYVGSDLISVRANAGALTSASCEQLLVGLAAGLAGPRTLPPVLALLPTARRVPGTLRYTRESFLGTRDLARCVHASYRSAPDGPTHQLLVMVTPEGGSVGAVWERLGKSWSAGRHGELEVLSRTIPYQGTVVVARTGPGGHVLGVAGVGSVEQGALLLEAALAQPRGVR